ncbi:hypothetical protein ACIQRS_22320 [Streptomyces termitum]|uniref:Uncharacterized protein n=1 Tax=Streptomyces termitum TaxID=67368 RepID=A0A918WBZ1_9ACTN|nr:hypothetical protein [Streptomyces termitum]GHA93096.1 hypothetical protein GCM10010305_41050 [Streptomyces termitum]
MPRGSRRLADVGERDGGLLGAAGGEEQFGVDGLAVGDGDGGGERLAEGVLAGDLLGLGGTAPGDQDLDHDAGRVPEGGGSGADALGEAESGTGEVLGLHEAAAPEADVADEGVREGEVGAAPAALLELGGARLEEFLGAAGPIGVEVEEGDQDRDLEAPALVGPAEAAFEGVGGVLEGDGGGFGAQGGVPGAQSDDVALGDAGLGGVAADEPVGEMGEAPGAGGRLGFVGAQGVPHELLGLGAQPGAGVGGLGDLLAEEFGGLDEAVAVGEDLGEAVDDAGAQGRVGGGLLKGGAQVVDGGGGFGEQ